MLVMIRSYFLSLDMAIYYESKIYADTDMGFSENCCDFPNVADPRGATQCHTFNRTFVYDIWILAAPDMGFMNHR